MIRSTPASMKRLPMLIILEGSDVPKASSSSAEVSPPAPNWIPHSGLAVRPAACTLSTMRSQSSGGREMKPADISMTSRLRSLHLRRYLSTAVLGSDCVRMCSIQPPWCVLVVFQLGLY